MIGRQTQVVDCRRGMGLGRGGGLAQRGTLSEAERPDIIAIGMSPGRRHITKPVCEITYGLRQEGLQVSVLVLNAGSGIPVSNVTNIGTGSFGISKEEIDQIESHKLAIIHLGNIGAHVVAKAKEILRWVNVPAIVACQNPLDYEDFAKEGVNTRVVKPISVESRGTIIGIVNGIPRGESVKQDVLNKLITIAQNELRSVAS